MLDVFRIPPYLSWLLTLRLRLCFYHEFKDPYQFWQSAQVRNGLFIRKIEVFRFRIWSELILFYGSHKNSLESFSRQWKYFIYTDKSRTDNESPLCSLHLFRLPFFRTINLPRLWIHFCAISLLGTSFFPEDGRGRAFPLSTISGEGHLISLPGDGGGGPGGGRWGLGQQQCRTAGGGGRQGSLL